MTTIGSGASSSSTDTPHPRAGNWQPLSNRGPLMSPSRPYAGTDLSTSSLLSRHGASPSTRHFEVKTRLVRQASVCFWAPDALASLEATQVSATGPSACAGQWYIHSGGSVILNHMGIPMCVIRHRVESKPMRRPYYKLNVRHRNAHRCNIDSKPV